MTEKDFAAILRPLNFGFATAWELWSFLCLCRKTTQIEQLFDCMENVIDNRKHGKQETSFCLYTGWSNANTHFLQVSSKT